MSRRWGRVSSSFYRGSHPLTPSTPVTRASQSSGPLVIHPESLRIKHDSILPLRICHTNLLIEYVFLHSLGITLPGLPIAPSPRLNVREPVPGMNRDIDKHLG